MNGLSVMNRTASTSRNILAVRSAMTCRSGKLAVMERPFPERAGWVEHSETHHRLGRRRDRDGFRCAQPILDELHHFPLDGLAATIDDRALVGAVDLHR